MYLTLQFAQIRTHCRRRLKANERTPYNTTELALVLSLHISPAEEGKSNE